jgi:antitoxin HicB
MKHLSYTVKIEPAEEGGYIASVPALPGCQTQGETYDEVVEMAGDAILCYVEGLAKHGLPVPVEKTRPTRSLRLDFNFPVTA